MKSGFTNEGLSGLSDSVSDGSLVLAKRVIRTLGPWSVRHRLIQVINGAYHSHATDAWAKQVKPYLKAMAPRPGVIPNADVVLKDLQQRHPAVFGLPVPSASGSPEQSSTDTSTSGSSTSDNQSSPTQKAPTPATQPKQSGSKWLGYGVVLAVLGGAAWYLMPEEEKKKMKSKSSN